jgi:hypothetical protein
MALGTNLGILASVTSTPVFSNTYSLDFDGVDDYVDCGNSAALKPNIITVSCWIKGSTQTAYTRIISQDGPTGGADAYGFYVTLALNKVVFAIKTDVTGTVTSATSGVVLDNSWHHLVGTYDGSEVILYVDGVAVGSPSAGTSILSYGIGGLTIGCFSEPTSLPSYLFNGNIDEVSIFNSVIPIGDLWDGSGVPTDLTSLSPIAWYRMGDNGAYKDPQWLLPSNENKDKVSNYSFEFDGVDDYVNCGSLSNLQNATEFSISCWFKPELAAVNGIWTWFDGADGWLELNCSADGSMIANVTRFNHTSATYGIAAAGTLTADTWYNATVVFDGSGATNADRLKLYVNGNLITLTFIGTIPTQTGTMLSSGLHIGERFNGQNYFNGNIDEVSIFDSAISIGDVWDGSGEPIDVSAVSGLTQNYRMGEEATFSGGVWTVPDAVGSNNGTSNAMTIQDRVGTAPSSSNNAVSFNMESVDRVTDVPI